MNLAIRKNIKFFFLTSIKADDRVIDPELFKADEGDYYNKVPEREILHDLTQRFNSPALYGSSPRAVRWPYTTKIDPETGDAVAGKIEGSIRIEGSVKFE